jgi:hypothetical protein
MQRMMQRDATEYDKPIPFLYPRSECISAYDVEAKTARWDYEIVEGTYDVPLNLSDGELSEQVSPRTVRLSFAERVADVRSLPKAGTETFEDDEAGNVSTEMDASTQGPWKYSTSAAERRLDLIKEHLNIPRDTSFFVIQQILYEKPMIISYLSVGTIPRADPDVPVEQADFIPEIDHTAESSRKSREILTAMREIEWTSSGVRDQLTRCAYRTS